MFSAFNPSKCADCAAPGEQSWTSYRSRDSNPQPWVTSGFKSNALSTARYKASQVNKSEDGSDANLHDRISYCIFVH